MRRIPALYQAVTTELRSPVREQKVSRELLGVCDWLYKRAFREYGLVQNYGFPGVEDVPERDYRVVRALRMDRMRSLTRNTDRVLLRPSGDSHKTIISEIFE